MQNSDNTLNLKQALLELLKVVKKNHYTKDENDSKLSLKVDDIIYQVDKNNLESEIKNLELSDEQIIGIINNEIKALIPNQASSTNQLADKDFVNSSISTATATFRGTYTSKSDFPLINVDINDYLWYDTTDSLGNRKFDKYKYSNGEWVYEYTLNNSSFTEEQWKAINSGATVELINKISINEENINNLNNKKLGKTEFNDFKNQNTLDLNNKVDKEEGKRLSTNDFTNELKEKLNGIEANAQVNTITGVKGDNEENYRVGNVSISKENIGLGNVDNTSDMDKPISTAQQQGLNKPLYNLGAFDTISGNVITRQTGYADLGSFDWGVTNLNAYDGQVTQMYINLLNNSTEATSFVSNILIPDGTFNPALYHAIISTDKLFFNIPLQTSTDSAIAYTLNLGIQLQYKLSTSYTEEIIEGQPLITLDSQGSQWLRDEWEKGLNLVDFSTFRNGQKEFTTSGNTGSQFNFEVWADDQYQTYVAQFRIHTDGSYPEDKTQTIPNSGLYYCRIGINGNKQDDKTNLVPIYLENGTYTFSGVFTTFEVNHIIYDGLMLNYGDHPYPYQPYNSKAHITNYEADFLKEESLKSANLLQKTNDQSYDLNFLENNISYTLSFSLSAGIDVTLVDGTSNVVDRGLSSGYHSFTFIKNSGGNASLWFSDVSKVSNLMLNKGTEPLPYQEYNGSIVREKQIEELKNEINSLKERIALLESKQ